MIGQISEPKQTETTQRWKLGLKVNNFSTLIPTKIEFSKRTNFSQEETAFTKINPQLTQKYKMYPIMANHYTLQAALNQKINALINRTETQARDVFDLQLLIDAGALPKDIWPDLINKLPTAITNLVNIDFAMFKSQVVAYLLPEYQKLYDKPENWQQIQEQLSSFLAI